MILYHFTSLYNLQNAAPEAILAAGLKPQPLAGWEHWAGLDAPPGVWLTRNPGDDHLASTVISRFDECRLTVVVPSRDRRLRKWRQYVLKRHPGEGERLDAIVREASEGVLDLRDWFIYFGTILPSAITDKVLWTAEHASVSRVDRGRVTQNIRDADDNWGQHEVRNT